MVELGVLECAVCGRSLPSTSFRADRKTVTGFSRYCERCHAAGNTPKSRREEAPRLSRPVMFERDGAWANSTAIYGSICVEEMRAQAPYREMMALCEQFEQRVRQAKYSMGGLTPEVTGDPTRRKLAGAG